MIQTAMPWGSPAIVRPEVGSLTPVRKRPLSPRAILNSLHTDPWAGIARNPWGITERERKALGLGRW